MIENGKPEWTRFDDPDFQVWFRFPDPTPGGINITRNVRKNSRMLRIHISSPKSGEIYFELTKYPAQLDPNTGKQNLDTENRVRFEDFYTSSLQDLVICALPAKTFSFSWKKARRNVIFFDVGKDSYRIIFDPGSPLNYQILDTIEIN